MASDEKNDTLSEQEQNLNCQKLKTKMKTVSFHFLSAVFEPLLFFSTF